MHLCSRYARAADRSQYICEWPQLGRTAIGLRPGVLSIPDVIQRVLGMVAVSNRPVNDR
jgi:hypothetical protein